MILPSFLFSMTSADDVMFTGDVIDDIGQTSGHQQTAAARRQYTLETTTKIIIKVNKKTSETNKIDQKPKREQKSKVNMKTNIP
jgi:hypothetical protein